MSNINLYVKKIARKYQISETYVRDCYENLVAERQLRLSRSDLYAAEDLYSFNPDSYDNLDFSIRHLKGCTGFDQLQQLDRAVKAISTLHGCADCDDFTYWEWKWRKMTVTGSCANCGTVTDTQ